MVIRELKPSRHKEGRWLAVLEDGSILRLGEGEVVDFALFAGKELTQEEGEALQQAALQGKRREKALELLARKPQSRRELERRREERGAGAEETGQVCDRLEELGYLDDARYAAQVVRCYAAKGYGEKKLRDELYRRGVPRQLWEEALDQAGDPEEEIRAFVDRKLKGKTPDRQELKKLSDALARRGYRWSQISQVLERYDGEGEADW